MSKKVRTVVINFQTPDLLKIAVESFRKHYPHSPLLIIDNGSKDDSKSAIGKLQQIAPKHTNVLLLDANIYHGPAMHLAMKTVTEDYIFFLDSDTQTIRGGFLDSMQAKFEESERTYAVGRQMMINKRGFPSNTGMTVLTPAYMMVHRKRYFDFAPFEHHGFPVMKNFFDAQQKGYFLGSFHIEEFIEHRWRGTASRFGYGLGWKSRLDFILNKIGL
jgi:GT2 family glycosyltransferase